jgi:inosine-uridine nucleoside N-ribohydrolase
MPDEMMAAQIIEPPIFSKPEKMYVDIDTTVGPRYGDSMLWPVTPMLAAGSTAQWHMGPPPSAGAVDVIMDLNRDRFKQLFVELMTKPIKQRSEVRG